MDNEQCKDCIHREVCAYKEHYEDVVELYKKAREETSKYPWFNFSIYCIKYNVEKLHTLRNAELPKHTNSLPGVKKTTKPHLVVKVISLEKVKQAREKISEMRKEQNVSVTDCLDVLDKLIEESEEK